MIIVSDQVQQTMDNDPVEFVFERSMVINGILPDGVDADEKIP